MLRSVTTSPPRLRFALLRGFDYLLPPCTRCRSSGDATSPAIHFAPWETPMLRTSRTFTTAQLRGVVQDLNTERARLERTLSLEEFDPKEIAVGVHTEIAARRDLLVAALERIADGSYGVCDRCQQDIPFGRLLVMPEATHCAVCLTVP